MEGIEVQEGRRRRRGSGKAGATAGLLSGPLLWITLFFFVPVVMIFIYSIGGISGLSPQSDITHFTTEHWKRFLTSDVMLGGIEPWGTGLFWKSVRLSFSVSVSAVVVAYPVAYLLAMVAGKRRYTMLLMIIVPFLTSYLLRILALRVLLYPQGLVSWALQSAGLADQPVQAFWNSTLAMYLVLTYVWVPFVTLPIFVSLESLNLQLLEASSDLGASRARTFRSVTLPLSLPGVMAAFVFVFIPTLGEYITPLLVGGPRGFMLGNAIQDTFTKGLDWQYGSAIAMFLVVTVAVLIAIFGRFMTMRSVAE